MSEWLRVRDVADSCHVSERLVWKWISDGLRSAKVGGVTLIKDQWRDSYLEGFVTKADNDVEEIVAEIMGGL